MSRNYNSHLVRMVDSLRSNINDAEAIKFEESYPLSKSADIEKKFKWAEDTCNYLIKNYDLPKVIEIRKQCRCNDGKSIAKKILKYLKKSGSIAEFVDAFNANETFAQLEYVTDNKILFYYPECYCSCVKRISKKIDRAWCYCTLGNAECIFKEVFKTDVKVKLLESIKTGGNKCKIEVEW